MMKNYKGFIFAAGVIIVVVVIYIIKTSISKNRGVQTPGSKKDNNTQYVDNIINLPTDANNIFPLKRGSIHEAVKYLKTALNYIAQKKGRRDINLILTTEANVFGTVTEKALFELYGTKICSKELAKKIAIDADMPEVSLLINNFE